MVPKRNWARSALTLLSLSEFLLSQFEHNGRVQGPVVNCRRAVGKLRRAHLQ